MLTVVGKDEWDDLKMVLGVNLTTNIVLSLTCRLTVRYRTQLMLFPAFRCGYRNIVNGLFRWIISMSTQNENKVA